ncbi:MAG: YncE family protein [Acidobacteriota bacterium]|nr:YncE family protein [Acidobacteriota bacterium]
MRIAAIVAAAFLAASTIVSGQEQSTPKQAVLALSKQDHTLSIIDPTSMRIVATVSVGDDPHEVAASTDGSTAYVSNYGFGRFHTLAVIDLVKQKQLPFIDLGALEGPHGLDFADGKVWFTAEVAKAIGSYNPATKKIDWIMGTGQNRTHMIYVFPGAKRILTTNVNSATVTILDKMDHSAGLAPGPPPGMQPGGGPPPGMRMGPPPGPPEGDWEETVIPVGHGSEGFDVSPDGKEAWIANAQDGTISVIDLAAKKVVTTLHVDVPGANRLKFTPDGKYVLVSPGKALVVLDAATRKVVHRLSDIHASGGILMRPDGSRAYVACGHDGYVAAVDLKTWKMVGKVAIAGPDGLAWADRK